MATLGHGECDGAGGTCRGALAKSPIITSKLGAAGGGLSGSWEHWEPAEDKTVQIGVEKKQKKASSGCQIFYLSHPPAPFAVPHFLSVINLVLLSSLLPLPPRLLTPPRVLSLPLTPGCLDGMKTPVLLSSSPLPEFLRSLWLRKGPETGGPGEPPAVVMSLQTLSCGDQATGLKECHWCWC